MKMLTEPFDLRAWRKRMGWTQAVAAERLGIHLKTYEQSEYRSQDQPGQPVRRTIALLARMYEERVRELV